MHSSDPQVEFRSGAPHCARSAFAIALALVAMLGAYGTVAAAQTSTRQGRDHRRRDPRRDLKYLDTPTSSTPRRSSTRRTSSGYTARMPPGRRSRPRPRGEHGRSTSVMAMAGPARTPTIPPTRRRTGSGSMRRAGNGDYNNKYYGEPSIRTLDFAPNAVVLLFHLCYASGNSEPGEPAPTFARRARPRVDNYGSAFLAAGASAVIADGHGHSGLPRGAVHNGQSLLGYGAATATSMETRRPSRRHEVQAGPTSIPTAPAPASTARSSATST